MKYSEWNPKISGFVKGVDDKVEGYRTFLYVVVIDDHMVNLLVENVQCVQTAARNLTSTRTYRVKIFW